MKDIEKLTAIFKKLGAPDPASWAQSEVQEGIPQLATFLFLRAAWKFIVPDKDSSWIDGARIPGKDANAPCSSLAPALQRMLAKGVDPADIHEVVRVMQYGLLFNLCYLTDDWTSGQEDLDDVREQIRDVRWGLFEVDAELKPLRKIACIHESALGMDPTGREMRPR